MENNIAVHFTGDVALKEEKRVKIYFGAPLFSNAELYYNANLAQRIKFQFGQDVSIYLPQENESINDKSGYADSKMIYDGDNEWLDDADILIALIDGQTMDVGLATEIGRFAKIAESSNDEKIIIGLYTDSRQGTYGNQQKIDALDEIAESQFSYVNLYTIGAIKSNGVMVRSEEELIDVLDTFIFDKKNEE